MRNASETLAVPGIASEFEGAELGDARRSRRLVKLAQTAALSPDLSFPQLASSDAELEAIYRFLSNEDVEWREILRPHQEASAARCAGLKDVLIIHDSSQFRLETEDDAREVGLLSGQARGFLAHFSLAVSDEVTRTPLGVLSFQPVVRRGYAASRKDYSRSKQVQKLATLAHSEKERERWYDGVQTAESLLEGRSSPIHVMDRGADGYMLWSRLVAAKQRFVIRAVAHGRGQRHRTIEVALDGTESTLLREIDLHRRPAQPASGTKKKRGDRAARMAELRVRAAPVTVKRTPTAHGAAEETTLNVVEVYEPAPPAGQEPIFWQLLTTEPVNTLENIARVVDIYRARWVVEEYFKALKTGCAYASRQLMTLRGLLNAMALFIPIAWRLLLLRTAARRTPSVPASNYLRPDELLLLRKLSKRVKLPAAPSIEQALLAIAGLGGHLKRNGPPGWQTLAAGYEQLAVALLGFRAAREM